MKLETSEGERAELTAWCTMKTEEWKSGFAPELTEQTVWAKTARLLRDIDTLLAEVERLRAAPPAPPLPAEVEEMRKAIEAYLDETANPGETLYDGHPKVLLNRAASLLSRWPGVWRPIETAPKDGTELLVGRRGDRTVLVVSYEKDNDPDFPWALMADSQVNFAVSWPTHWQPIPEPPNE